MLEFEDGEEAKRVLKRRVCRYKETCCIWRDRVRRQRVACAQGRKYR